MRSATVFVFFVLVLLGTADCRPNSRIKRVSDQRLAELNTKIGLSNLKGQIVTIPVAHGKLDPMRIGRRRRSQSNLLELLMSPQDDNFQDEMAPDLTTYEDGYRR